MDWLRCNTRIGRQEQMLDRVALFRELSSDQLSFLNARATVRTYPKGAVIVNEGDEGNSLFVIQSGTVKVYLRNDKGKELVLSTQGPDEYFGDLALFDDAPRSASVAALEACRLLVISKSVLREALTERPEIALMRILTESIRTFAFLDVFGRLVRTLHALASEKDGHLVIDQKLTQQDLANRIGASREMVSRIMNDLVEGGYIKVDSKRILICKTIPSKW
jgi:CRP/FNR family transcriptional regulator, cyclic AMP receptor protein